MSQKYFSIAQARQKAPGGFTLLELLLTIVLLAVLVAAAFFSMVDVTGWAKSTSDRQTLTILNDALTRYKTQGGNVSALTVGADIGALLTRMESATTWGSMSHQFLRMGVTYQARSIGAMGSQAAYNFYRYNTYSTQTPGVGVPTNQYVYGQEVGYMADASGSYQFECTTTTNYVAVKDSSGTVTICEADSVSVDTYNPSGSITFWSCASAGDSTPSGTITTLYCSGDAYTGQITALNVSGLTSLTSLDCSNNMIQTLNLAGLTALTEVNCSANALASVNFSGLTLLTTINCAGNNYTSLSVSNLPLLTDLEAASSGMTSITISGLPSLTHVGVGGSALDAAALNALYTALPSRVSLSAGLVSRIGNPGAGGATNSIATAKNWTLH